MGKVKRRRDEEIRRASRVIFESEAGAVSAPQINGKLRSFALHVPDAVNECSGIVVFGKRIRSLVFSTDVATIRNVDADAVWSVYPYTPQQIIAEALIHAADIPVFVGVGGGLTQGKRVVHLASFAEMQGAAGVIVNAPTDNSVVRRLVDTVDIPVIVTTVSAKGVGDRLRSGASVIHVAAGDATPEVVAQLRKEFPTLPIIATGGPTDESVQSTVDAGANAIVWTPPTPGEVFREIMAAYREDKPHP